MVNPYTSIIERMGLLLIATAIMMIFVIGCIIYQIRLVVRLNKISQIREDFSYAMIHDMKTPLSSIIMSNQILDSGKLDGKPDMKKNCHSIISNLIDNAVKYSKEEADIHISSREAEDFCIISVRDNGIDIPLKEQQTIFNKFERASSVRAGKRGGVGGFGLGLNYVYQVMQAHGGKVSVESREGKYSEFTLYFPEDK